MAYEQIITAKQLENNR